MPVSDHSSALSRPNHVFLLLTLLNLQLFGRPVVTGFLPSIPLGCGLKRRKGVSAAVARGLRPVIRIQNPRTLYIQVLIVEGRAEVSKYQVPEGQVVPRARYKQYESQLRGAYYVCLPPLACA